MKDEYDRINDFLDGNMDPEAQKQFMEEAGRDAALNEKLAFMRALRGAYRQPGHMEFLEKVEHAHQAWIDQHADDDSSARIRLFNRRVVLYAAAAIVILGMVVTLVLLSGHPSDQTLYRKYYAALDQSITFRGNGEAATRLNRAMQLYKQGAYRQAIAAFKQADDAFSDEAQLFMGLCYMQLKQFDDAIESLKGISPKSELHQEATWYLALAYLAEGRREQSRKMLKLILETPGNDYREQARNLLADLV